MELVFAAVFAASFMNTVPTSSSRTHVIRSAFTFKFKYDDNDDRIRTSQSRGVSKLCAIVKNGRMDSEAFINVEESWWGVQPLLIKGAFDSDVVKSEGGWPSLDDTIELACDEDAESRLITYSPDEGYVIELGPFEEYDVRGLLADNKSNSLAWTLLVNDVDRFFPAVSDWIDENFSFIPHWRRDDGQISIASKNGGIGLHVDNYDVFLVQTAGKREWKVGTSLISIEEEYSFLIPGLDVRVLDLEQMEITKPNFQLESFVLEAGDVLYIPPRVPHWGTALSDDCATFSVGCRAPSGADLIARVAESFGSCLNGNVIRRYEDNDLVEECRSNKKYSKGEITRNAKEKMKSLIRDSVEELLGNDEDFDEWLGSIITEPKRLRHDYPIPLELSRGDISNIINDFTKGKCLLHQAEGLTFAYSRSAQNYLKLFVNGESFEVDSLIPVEVIANKKTLSMSDFESKTLNEKTSNVLQSLLQKGFLYYSDEEL